MHPVSCTITCQQKGKACTAPRGLMSGLEGPPPDLRALALACKRALSLLLCCGCYPPLMGMNCQRDLAMVACQQATLQQLLCKMKRLHVRQAASGMR